MTWKEFAKRRASIEAIKLIKNRFKLGLGSGTTASIAIKEIGKKIKKENLKILGVATSYQTFLLAIDSGIPITTLKEHPILDLYIDGTDQIDCNLNLIKGRGGALTREKIIASSSKKFIVIGDETKYVEKLGENQSLPIEVLPLAEPLVSNKIIKIGGNPKLRQKLDGSGPYMTDNNNFIIHANFGSINNPKKLQIKLKSIPGVIETGLFIDLAHIAYLGTKNSVKTMYKKSS